MGSNTNIAVPKVFAIYQKDWQEAKITYIIMENNSGKTLISLWGNPTESEKAFIAS